MSYDFYLFKPEPGADPLEAAETLLRAEESSELNPGPPQKEREELKRRLALALIQWILRSRYRNSITRP